MLAFVCAPLAVTLLRLVGASRAYWHQPLSAFILGELQAWSWAIVFAMAPAFMYARREPGRRWDATTSRLLAAGLLLSIASVGWVGPITFGVMEHAHGHFLDGRAQPAFASLPTVVRMVRAHATDANWPHFLTGRLIMIADALLLALIGWRLSAIRRPTIGRVTFWWFALMEFVLLSGGFAINQAEWQQWRASGVLVLILLALYVAAKRNRPDLSVRPTPPDPPGLPDVVS